MMKMFIFEMKINTAAAIQQRQLSCLKVANSHNLVNIKDHEAEKM